MSPLLDFIHQFVPGISDRTLLLLHGTGGTEHDLIRIGRSLDSAATLLSPRGKVLENGMPRFFRRLAEGVFDVEDLKKRTAELADFIAAAALHYGFDAGQIIGVGYSQRSEHGRQSTPAPACDSSGSDSVSPHGAASA